MNVLIIGSEGQLGSELYDALVRKYPNAQVVCSDIRNAFPDKERSFEILNATDAPALYRIIEKYQISQIYHLAAILSARGEQNPLWAWDINMRGLLVV